MGEKRDTDVEKVYSTSEFVAKLRRLADALEAGERFEIQVAGERIYVPARGVQRRARAGGQRGRDRVSAQVDQPLLLVIVSSTPSARKREGSPGSWLRHSHHLASPTS